MGQELSRRRFGRRIITLAIASNGLRTLHAGGAQAETRLTIDLEEPRYEPLLQIGGAVKVTPEGSYDPVIIVRLSEEDFTAYSSTCPHFSCEVDLPDANGIVLCPCHGSLFDLRGRHIEGPAGTDLSPVPLEVTRPTAVRSSGWSEIKKGR
ncbi:MAG TPA: Rieske (2Fe-2S) protein [Candidatus Latescibacteria bacterium]|jgi:Rieske Fe-S protein|nr:Rieske (2Fe-2S) protein [Candidatus Latescibacterota bacterium]HJP31611.1 Rieske (2Fe-2S) protein [Candidatus Latescibacterota bacterium]